MGCHFLPGKYGNKVKVKMKGCALTISVHFKSFLISGANLNYRYLVVSCTCRTGRSRPRETGGMWGERAGRPKEDAKA